MSLDGFVDGGVIQARCDRLLHTGYIALQGEGSPVDFRGVSIRELP